MSMSVHASKRAQQRSVPPLIIDWLLDYGAETPADDGASIRFFDKCSRRRLERACGRRVIHKLESWMNSFLIESDGTVITTGKLYKHIRRR